jgi:hypothetical protein
MRYVFSPRLRANLFVVFSSALLSRKTSGCSIAAHMPTFIGIGLVARDEIRGRDSPLTNRTSDVPRAASSIYLERRTVGPAR